MADDHITIKLPQLPLYDGTVKGDDMVYVWHAESGKLTHALVSQLPFGSGGGSGQPLLGSPFKVRLGDTQVTVVGGNTVVSDVRLAGKTDYPVSSSQLNNAIFRDNELAYDSPSGTVTILGFELQAGEVLALFPDGVAGSGGGSGSLQPILDRLATVEAMLAPFKPRTSGPNLGRVWWTGTLEQLAEMPGWVEDQPWRGRVPYHWNPSDTDFNTPGKVGGSKTHKNEIEHIPPHKHSLGGTVIKLNGGTTPSGGGDTSRRSLPQGQFELIGETLPVGGESGQAVAFSIVNEYRVGMWIRFEGISST